jgi:hypothetical protein
MYFIYYAVLARRSKNLHEIRYDDTSSSTQSPTYTPNVRSPPKQTSMVNCSICGTDIPENKNFCTECGTEIEKTDQSLTSQPSHQPRKFDFMWSPRVLKILFAFILLAEAVLYLWFYATDVGLILGVGFIFALIFVVLKPSFGAIFGLLLAAYSLIDGVIYSGLDLVAYLPEVLVILVGVSLSLSLRARTAEEEILVDSAFASVRDGLGTKLSIARTRIPVDLSEFVSEHVSLEDVKNILGDVVDESGVVGWFLGEEEYLTETALCNLIEYDVQAKGHDVFDFAEFAETVGVELRIVRKRAEYLLKDERIKGYLTIDNKLITQEHLQNTLKKLIK